MNRGETGLGARTGSNFGILLTTSMAGLTAFANGFATAGLFAAFVAAGACVLTYGLIPGRKPTGMGTVVGKDDPPVTVD